MDIVQISSGISMGYNIGKCLMWFKDTKIAKYLMGFFILPYLIWAIYKLSKDDFIIKLMDKIERGKITYYFPSPDKLSTDSKQA